MERYMALRSRRPRESRHFWPFVTVCVGHCEAGPFSLYCSQRAGPEAAQRAAARRSAPLRFALGHGRTWCVDEAGQAHMTVFQGSEQI